MRGRRQCRAARPRPPPSSRKALRRPRCRGGGTYLPDKVTWLVSPGGRPPVSGASKRAGKCGARLCSSALWLSPLLPSPPLRSPPRGSSAPAAPCPELATRAPSCPARTGSAGPAAAAAAGAAGRCRTSGPQERKGCGETAAARAQRAGWAGGTSGRAVRLAEPGNTCAEDSSHRLRGRMAARRGGRGGRKGGGGGNETAPCEGDH